MAVAYRRSGISSNQRRAITTGVDLYDPYAAERERLDRVAAQVIPREQLLQQAYQYEKNFAENKRQFEENQKRADENAASQKNASMVSGIAGLAGLGLQGYAISKLLEPTVTPNAGLLNTGTGLGIDRATGQTINLPTNSTTPIASNIANTGLNTTTPAVTTGLSQSSAPALSGLGTSLAGDTISGGGIGTTVTGGTMQAAPSTVGGAAVTPSFSSSVPVTTMSSLAPEMATTGTGTVAPSATSSAGAVTPSASSLSPILGWGGVTVAPALAGLSAPGLVDSIHKDTTENIGHNMTFGVLSSEQDARTQGSATVGAASGALTGLAAGASYGGPIGGPLGAGIGAIIGSIAGAISANTWLCTATKDIVGLDEREMLDIYRLRRYALKEHAGMMQFYLDEGGKLVKAISEKEGNKVKDFYIKLKNLMVLPCINLVRKRELEEAYKLYRDITEKLFREYTPEIEIREHKTMKEVS